jgi:hypothetical protein
MLEPARGLQSQRKKLKEKIYKPKTTAKTVPTEKVKAKG